MPTLEKTEGGLPRSALRYRPTTADTITVDEYVTAPRHQCSRCAVPPGIASQKPSTKMQNLLETLQGTACWQAILNVFAAGGVVAGCSAGAMVLGAALLDFPRTWRTLPALGLAPGIAIIPHFDEIPSLLTHVIAAARRSITVVGIDGSTALDGSNGQWSVQGKGGVTVFTSKQKTRYLAGDEVPLPQALHPSG